MNNLLEFKHQLEQSIQDKTLIKLTLSSNKGPEKDLKNVYIRPVEIKGSQMYQFTYRYATKDIVKNFSAPQTILIVEENFGTNFFNAVLFTTVHDVYFSTQKNGLKIRTTPPANQASLQMAHDVQKHRFIPQNALFLQQLGITNTSGNVKPDQYDKYRQIDKFIEITSNLYSTSELAQKDSFSIVDMGSGKSYLTFALYYYFTEVLHTKVEVTGVEMRKELVELSNKAASELGYKQLKFIEGSIEEYKAEKTDMVVALHACDTATDDAIAQGVMADASLLIFAPCCQKYVRKHMTIPPEQKGLYKHGILEEKLATIITDGLRALTLEYFGYKTQVFEFISSEFTSKNVLLTAVKNKRREQKEVLEEIHTLKNMYKLADFYLDKILKLS